MQRRVWKSRKTYSGYSSSQRKGGALRSSNWTLSFTKGIAVSSWVSHRVCCCQLFCLKGCRGQLSNHHQSIGGLMCLFFWTLYYWWLVCHLEVIILSHREDSFAIRNQTSQWPLRRGLACLGRCMVHQPWPATIVKAHLLALVRRVSLVPQFTLYQVFSNQMVAKRSGYLYSFIGQPDWMNKRRLRRKVGKRSVRFYPRRMKGIEGGV